MRNGMSSRWIEWIATVLITLLFAAGWLCVFREHIRLLHLGCAMRHPQAKGPDNADGSLRAKRVERQLSPCAGRTGNFYGPRPFVCIDDVVVPAYFFMAGIPLLIVCCHVSAPASLGRQTGAATEKGKSGRSVFSVAVIPPILDES